MKKNKMLIILIVCISAFLVFATVVIIGFNSISNNPIDKLAMTYLWNYTEIPDQYGEIISIGKNGIHKTEKSETLIKSPYTVETKTGRVIAYVTLKKKEGRWKADAYEIVEVIPNE